MVWKHHSYPQWVYNLGWLGRVNTTLHCNAMQCNNYLNGGYTQGNGEHREGRMRSQGNLLKRGKLSWLY